MDWQSVVFIPLVLLIAAASVAWHFGRSRSLLDRWAERHGDRILHSEYRYLVRGPFFWTTSKGQTVYRVTVEDKAGDTRGGWVRCGGWWLGLWSDHVEARWDEAPPKEVTMRDRWLDG
jgi:hypothetical protein